MARSVYSSDDRVRHEANGVVKFIDQWLSGKMETHYEQEAKDALGLTERKPEEATGGSYMESDGLD